MASNKNEPINLVKTVLGISSKVKILHYFIQNVSNSCHRYNICHDGSVRLPLCNKSKEKF